MEIYHYIFLDIHGIEHPLSFLLCRKVAMFLLSSINILRGDYVYVCMYYFTNRIWKDSRDNNYRVILTL